MTHELTPEERAAYYAKEPKPQVMNGPVASPSPPMECRNLIAERLEKEFDYKALHNEPGGTTQDYSMIQFKRKLLCLERDKRYPMIGITKQDAAHNEPLTTSLVVSDTDPGHMNTYVMSIWFSPAQDKVFVRREDDADWTEVTRFYAVFNRPYPF